jgi:methylated-DNA-[protein]-cysteine S-methyltransferase
VTYVYKTVDSPLGPLKLIATARGLAAILWDTQDPDRMRMSPLVARARHPILLEAQRQLREYFGGRLRSFTVPLDLQGTEFQRRVWTALLAIPFGETRTYGQIARQLGMPTASRAVGAANGQNPLSIIAPCHRLIGSKGDLRGYAGGLGIKRRLLDFEAVDAEGGRGKRTLSAPSEDRP